MRSSLTWKVALLLIVPSFGAFLSFVLFWSFHGQSNPASIDLAGRQRMIAVQLGQWAHMVAAMGQDEDRAGLRERVAEFDRTLTVLEQGGSVDGHTLEHSPKEVLPFIAGVREVWSEVEPRLLVIADRPATSPEAERAYLALGAGIGELRTTSDLLARATQDHVMAARARIRNILGAMAGLSLALLLLGLWYARRFIVQPILQIDSAARRIHDGDLTARAEVPSGNELSTLARTFNEMAARVEGLLVALDLRRKHAEILTDNMPIGSALLDESLVVVRSCHSFQRIFQRSEAEITGRSVTELLPAEGLAEQLLAVIQSGESAHGLLFELVRPDGTTCPLRVHAASTHLGDGGQEETARLVLLVENLAEEERLRVAAQAAEARLTHLVAASPAAIFSARAHDLGVTYVSDNIVQHAGYGAQELTANPLLWVDRLHPDDRTRAFEALSTLPESGQVSVEHRFRHKDGSYRWIQVELKLQRYGTGRPDDVVGALFDITEHKKAEEQHRLLQRAMEHSANVVVITDARGNIEYVNPQFTRSTGYDPVEAIGNNPRILKSGETPAEVYAELWRTILSGKNWQGLLHNKKKSGELYWESATISPVLDAEGVVTHFVAVKQDITERRKADEALRQNEERLSLALSSAGQALWDWDVARDEAYLSPEYWRMIGYDEGEVRADMAFVQSLVHPEDAPQVAESMERHLQGQSAQSVIDYRMRRRSGDYVWIHGIGRVAARDGKGAPQRMVGVIMDITERRQAEQSMRESEERYRTLFDNAPIGLGVADAEGNILAFNRAMVAPGGYTQQDAGAIRNVADLYADPIDRSRLFELLREHGRVDREEVDFKRKDGSRFTNLLTLRPVVVGGQRGVLAMMEDISERRALEAQMRAAQKMDALGRLAGGVAHDFNNLLTVIISYAGFVRDELRQEDPRRDDITEVLRAADSAASLTQHLLVFSRRTKIAPIIVDLNALVLDLDRMLRRLIGEDLELAILPGADVMTVRVDPRQFEQVIVNLAVNARDAMPTGGTLTIALSSVARAEGDHAQPPSLPPGTYVMLQVTDTGCGMDDETLERIFEPFFTTKEEGKGTGLGLATCYGIVTQFGGHVVVESNPGQGTTFRVYLPRVEGAPGRQQTGSVPQVSLEGSETVLVVEDQRAVRQLAVRALRGWGYRVLEADNGEAALALIREHGGAIDLLLSDVVMPKMSGTELAARFREACPGARVLLMSGYTDEEANRHGVLESGYALLQKPFMPNTLVLRVREALAGGPVTKGP